MFADISTAISAIAEHPGQAFHSVLVAALIGTAVLMVLHLALSLFGRRTTVPRARWNLWERLVYAAIVISVAILGITSFFAVLRFGVLEGWMLFAHMFGAGAFVFVLPVFAITWCEASRFGAGRTAGTSEEEAECAPRFFWFPKLMFWIMLAGGLIVTMTMLLSMLPLFGTDGLHALLDVHRYSGLLVVVAAALHFYSVLLQRVGLR
jgi:hypothetical protein